MKKYRKLKKRILSVLMISCMCITMLPQGAITALAAEESVGEEYNGQEEPGIYTISAPDQLKLLADQVNAGNSYADTTFKLAADIDMSVICAGFQWGGWEPIGVDPKKPFSGTFDGGKENEYKITGLSMKIDKNLLEDYYQDRRSPNLPSRGDSDDYPCFGLFGYVDGVIQNLVVEGDIQIEGVASNYYFGGIVGYAKAGSTIKECDYAGILMTKGTAYHIGGIAGCNEGTVENCTNIGTIEMTGSKGSKGPSEIGGIVGWNEGMVKQCSFAGAITNDNEMRDITTIGGIVGYANRGSTIENCTNTGDITITKAISLQGIGGIVGSVAEEVKNCTNKGNITVEAEDDESNKVGGIAGCVSDYTSTKMTGCTNIGEIKAGNVRYVGGVTGVIGSMSNYSGVINTIADCANKGTVEGFNKVGGIVGSGENITGIKKCYNQGRIMAVSDCVGGILGRAYAGEYITVESCYNQGDVCGEAKYAGGIVGYDGIYATTTIENCYNTGSIDIEGESAGSIIGGAGNFNTTSGNYYLENGEAAIEGQTPKDDIQFQFGEVTYLLQEDRKNLAGSDESIWGQQLTGDEIDKYPVFTEDENKKVQGIGLWYEHDSVRYEGYANADGNAPLPDDSILSFPGSDVTMEVGSNNDRTTFNEEGEVTLPVGGNLRIGSSNVTAPDRKATIRTEDKERVTLPEDVTVELEKDDIKLGLPDGGAMDKDGNLTIDKDDRFVIKGTTVTVPEEVVIEPDEEGNIELLPGTRAELSAGEEMDLPKGGVIDRNGNITPYGGVVEVDTKSGEGAPEITVPEAEDLDFVLDDEDRKAVAGGRDIKILFTVESIAAGTISAGDTEKIKTAASYYEIGNYLDISLYKRIMANEVIEKVIPIYETDQPVSIGIEIPTDLKKIGRTYAVVRLHEGEATRIEDMDDNPDTVTIETDRFSTYVIVYTDLTDEDRVHTHTPGTEWKADEDGHWNICTKEDCPDKEEQLNYSKHSWDSGKVTKEPTQETNGEKTYTCSICGRTKTETMDKLPYNPGNVEKEAQSGKNAPKAELPQKMAEIQEAVFTEEDQRDMEQGKDIKILLTVEDASNMIKAEEKQKIEEGASYYTIGQYLDINLIKVVTTDNDSEEKKVTNTKKPIRIVIDIPENLKGNGKRTYAIVRLHENETTLLEDMDNNPDTVTIETDRFSTYAVVYTEISPEENTIAMNAKLKVEQKDEKIHISWGKAKGADGYMAYIQYCGKKFSSKPTKEVKSAKTTKVTVTKINGKKLNLKKNYKIYVTAYKLVNNKKVVIGKTIAAHIVGEKNKTYTNVKQVKVSKSKYTLKVGKTAKIKAKTVLVDVTKKQLSDKHAKEFRYKSTDTDVAVVSAKGKITAKGKGICYIYVYARNGYAKKVKVMVE